MVLKARGEELAPALLEALDRELSLDDPTKVLSYQDSRKDIAKRALVEGDSLAAVRLAGETKAADWLTDMMVQGHSAAAVRPWLLAPLTQPPAGQAARGKVICNCFDVAEDDILNAFRAGESLDSLQVRTSLRYELRLLRTGTETPSKQRFELTSGNAGPHRPGMNQSGLGKAVCKQPPECGFGNRIGLSDTRKSMVGIGELLHVNALAPQYRTPIRLGVTCSNSRAT